MRPCERGEEEGEDVYRRAVSVLREGRCFKTHTKDTNEDDGTGMLMTSS